MKNLKKYLFTFVLALPLGVVGMEETGKLTHARSASVARGRSDSNPVKINIGIKPDSLLYRNMSEHDEKRNDHQKPSSNMPPKPPLRPALSSSRSGTPKKANIHSQEEERQTNRETAYTADRRLSFGSFLDTTTEVLDTIKDSTEISKLNSDKRLQSQIKIATMQQQLIAIQLKIMQLEQQEAAQKQASKTSPTSESSINVDKKTGYVRKKLGDGSSAPSTPTTSAQAAGSIIPTLSLDTTSDHSSDGGQTPRGTKSSGSEADE